MMFKAKVGVAVGCLFLLAGGTARAQGVVPGGWESGFESGPFATVADGSGAAFGPGSGGWGVGNRFAPASIVAVPWGAGGIGMGRVGVTPTTEDELGGMARALERSILRRRGR